jgi:hypothetical protein
MGYFLEYLWKILVRKTEQRYYGILVHQKNDLKNTDSYSRSKSSQLTLGALADEIKSPWPTRRAALRFDTRVSLPSTKMPIT